MPMVPSVAARTVSSGLFCFILLLLTPSLPVEVASPSLVSTFLMKLFGETLNVQLGAVKLVL